MNKKYTILLCAIVGIIAAVYAARSIDEQNGTRVEDIANSITQPATSDNEETSESSNTKTEKNSSTATFHQPASLTDRPDMPVRHSGHILSYNTKNNTPNWVAWRLTRAMTKGSLERSTKFWADPQIPKAYRVDYFEYKESGYDRGHMCPAADNKWNQDAMHDCFYMSNMCPQDPTLNSHSWERLESKCRDWAVAEGTIFICCGPYYAKGRTHEAIGITHRILVPDGFFKVVLSLRKGKEKAIGFYYTNTSNSQSPDKTACSVDDIERKTGIDFFADLDDKLEAKVESMNNINAWK